MSTDVCTIKQEASVVMASTEAIFRSNATFLLPASAKKPSPGALETRPSSLLAGSSWGACDGGSGRTRLSGPIALSSAHFVAHHNAHSCEGLASVSSSFLSNWCPLTSESQPGSRRPGNFRVQARLAHQSLEKKQKLAFEPKKASTTFDEIDSVAKEPHKYFDQAVINVKAGDGGNGTLIKKTKKKPAAKGQKARRPKARRGPDGEIQLPMGGGGGDIVLYADPNLETLLEFHRKKKFQGGRGGHVDAMLGLGADLLSGTDAPELRVPVPVGKLHLLEIATESFQNRCLSLCTCFYKTCGGDNQHLSANPNFERWVKLVMRNDNVRRGAVWHERHVTILSSFQK